MDLILLLGGLLGVFAAMFLALTAIGVFTNEARGVSKSLTVIEAFSAAPPEMQRELTPSFQDRVLGPLLDRSLAMGKRITRSDHTDADQAEARGRRQPPGLDGRPGDLAEVPRPGPLPRGGPAARPRHRRELLDPARDPAGHRGARLPRPQPLPLPARLRPDEQDAAGAARRARPAHDLGRVGPRLRRRPLPGRTQHRGTARRGVRPRAPGDADRQGPGRRAARPR